jgi:hypothetical protein
VPSRELARFGYRRDQNGAGGSLVVPQARLNKLYPTNLNVTS